MSQWARNNPEAMEEIAALPLSEQARALADAADELADSARRFPPFGPKSAGTGAEAPLNQEQPAVEGRGATDG